MHSSKLMLLAASFALAACASSGSGSSSGNKTITAEQIAQADAPTVFDAVDRLHRSWFRDVAHPESPVSIYWDNNDKLGTGPDVLRTIPSQNVVSIQYIRGNDAILRYGQEALGGVILLTRKK